MLWKLLDEKEMTTLFLFFVSMMLRPFFQWFDVCFSFLSNLMTQKRLLIALFLKRNKKHSSGLPSWDDCHVQWCLCLFFDHVWFLKVGRLDDRHPGFHHQTSRVSPPHGRVLVICCLMNWWDILLFLFHCYILVYIHCLAISTFGGRVFLFRIIPCQVIDLCWIEMLSNKLSLRRAKVMRFDHETACRWTNILVDKHEIMKTYPDTQCMVYIPTFTIKIDQM